MNDSYKKYCGYNNITRPIVIRIETFCVWKVVLARLRKRSLRYENVSFRIKKFEVNSDKFWWRFNISISQLNGEGFRINEGQFVALVLPIKKTLSSIAMLLNSVKSQHIKWLIICNVIQCHISLKNNPNWLQYGSSKRSFCCDCVVVVVGTLNAELPRRILPVSSRINSNIDAKMNSNTMNSNTKALFACDLVI